MLEGLYIAKDEGHFEDKDLGRENAKKVNYLACVTLLVPLYRCDRLMCIFGASEWHVHLQATATFFYLIKWFFNDFFLKIDHLCRL